jgi:OOP family OmpA-OmpF porin
MVEGGLYGGVLLPSGRHNLFPVTPGGDGEAWEPLRPAAASFGLRIGYYPIRWVGVELEQGLAPTRTRDTEERVNLFTVRAHALFQMPWRITPTLHAGAGAIGITQDSLLGGEVDTALYFGAGAKLYITRWAVVRLDVRDVMTEARGDGLAHSPEILLGVGAVLGRRSAAAPEPRARKRQRQR